MNKDEKKSEKESKPSTPAPADKKKETQEIETSSSAPVSEEFQKKVQELVKSCKNDEMLDFIQDCVFKAQRESVPETYSDDNMPKD